MSAIIESGHSKNVASLLKLNQHIATLGASYNPANANLTTTAFATLYANADAKVNGTNTTFTNWKDATNQREIEFNKLRKLSTQLLGALQSTTATQQTVDDFAFLVKKLRGSSKPKSTKPSAGKLSNPNPPIAIDPGTVPTDPNPPTDTSTISTSQQSFDSRIQHFTKMILLLESQPTYAPNEVEFQVPTLQTKNTVISALNDTANTTYASLKTARIDRNTFLYAANTGLLDLVKQSKAYIKSIYGAESQQYHACTAIKFYRIIKKLKAN